MEDCLECRTERVTREKYKTEAGVWIEQFLTAAPRAETTDTGGNPAAPAAGLSAEALRARFQVSPDPAASGAPGQERSPTREGGNQVSTIMMSCRAVNTGDRNILYTLMEELKASPMFDQIQLSPDTTQDDYTFSFQILLKLKRPLNL
jgi:hypothetical protein